MPQPIALPTPAIPFAEAWTFADTAAYFRAEATCPKGEGPEMSRWRSEVYTPLAEKMHLAIAGHAAFLSKEGRFSLPEHEESFQMNWLSALKAVIAGDADYPWGHLAVEPFSMALSMELMGLQDKVEKGMTLDAAHKEWVSIIEAGDFGSRMSDTQECFLTGERVKAVLKGWKMQLQVRRDGRFVPVSPEMVQAPGMEAFEIDLPTGELWINDWFRIPAFTEITKAAAQGLSGNSEKGDLEQVRAYAKLGFVSVFAGNSCPSVVIENGQVVIGCLSEEGYEDEALNAAGRERKGGVCTDLWRATMIDRQVLVDLVAQSMSREEAEKKVAELAEKTKDHLTVLRLPPGRRVLYAAGSPDTFAKQFDMQEVSLAGFDDPMCVLASAPLTPRLKAELPGQEASPASASKPRAPGF